MNIETFEKTWNEFADKASSVEAPIVVSTHDEVLENGASQEVLTFLEQVGASDDLTALISVTSF